MVHPSIRGIILIVDDNPANLGVLSDFLYDAGFEVRVAKSGQAAIDRVEYDPPDLILLDVMMPGIDGFETCERLKQNHRIKEIPIIFMTALADTENKVKGLSLGAVDYITKPFQQQEVLARVNLHLKLYQLTQESQQYNAQLEERVAERTIELKQALESLQKVQVQLIQSEKMSSLGQLVAGIAHEINNPVNFIYGNLIHADDYTQRVLEILQLYRHQFPTLPPDIAEKVEAADLDFILEDLPHLLSSMKIGAERIRNIVTSLRHFSRMDEAEIKGVNIHEGIDSTLMILQNRFKSSSSHFTIELSKKYAELPLIECYPGPLNQVFMNLIANAIDAVQERSEQETSFQGKISIETQLLNPQWVQIEIKDNGTGITEEVHSQMFNPFFTTKPVGKGTGMGLAISYSIIVDKHNGQLHCHSELGHGSKFMVQIPVRQEGEQSPYLIKSEKNWEALRQMKVS